MRRRILAVLVLLLLLALLVPRAYQAFLGSDEDTGSREDRKTGAAETATGTDAKDADTEQAGTKDASSDRGAPFIKGKADSEGASGAERGDEAATDLTAMIVGPAVIGGDEEPAVQDIASGEPSVDQTARRLTGAGTVGGRQATQQPIVEPQNAPETSRAPARQPPSDNVGAPTNRQSVGLSGRAANPPRERIRGGGNVVATVPVAARSRFGGVRVRLPKPVTIEPVVNTPVVNTPVVNTPVVPAPTAVPRDTGFVAGRASVAGGLANNFGGITVGGARPVPAALPRGPRLAATVPIRTPRPAIF